MKKCTILFFLFSFSFHNAIAQKLTETATQVKLLLVSDYKNEIKSFYKPLTITNSETAIISGDFSSIAVNIVPTSGYSIIIKPLVAISSPTGRIMRLGTSSIRASAKRSSPVRKPQEKPNIYPNPVTTDLNFSSPDDYVISYQVFDLLGNLLLSANIIPTTLGSIDVSNLAQGMYLLKLTLQHQNVNLQFIKN
jgi:Secretion system C-terminal sorting domain